MILHGTGDAMGYKNGEWEFNFVGENIHHDLKKLGRLEAIRIDESLFYFAFNKKFTYPTYMS
jgi:hypothetical protein